MSIDLTACCQVVPWKTYNDVEIVFWPGQDQAKSWSHSWLNPATDAIVSKKVVESIVMRARSLLIRGGYYAGGEATALQNMRFFLLHKCPDLDAEAKACRLDDSNCRTSAMPLSVRPWLSVPFAVFVFALFHRVGELR